VLPKHSSLSGEYGAWFKDPALAAAYPARPAYPAAAIELLQGLIVDTPQESDVSPSGARSLGCDGQIPRKLGMTPSEDATQQPRRVLDIGCGTGELARRLAPHVDAVDAVDFSAPMLGLARTLPGGDAGNITWIESAVEDAALRPPYALITAGESLHWMEWDVVLPKLGQLLSPNGVLAVLERDVDGPAGMNECLLPLVQRYSPVRDYRPHALVDELTGRKLFLVSGYRVCGPEEWRPSIEEYLEARHSQRGLSRTHMGPEAVQAFDTLVREALAEFVNADGRLPLQVRARVTWGKPLGG
jgi:SAM-dependent methyltransferase